MAFCQKMIFSLGGFLFGLAYGGVHTYHIKIKGQALYGSRYFNECLFVATSPLPPKSAALTQVYVVPEGEKVILKPVAHELELTKSLINGTLHEFLAVKIRLEEQFLDGTKLCPELNFRIVSAQ